MRDSATAIIHYWAGLRRILAPSALPAVTILAIAGLIFPVSAQAPGAKLLASLERGGWAITIRDDGTTRRVCLGSGNELIQIRHARTACEHFIVSDQPNRLTVQYTCPGSGYGRTTIRKENSRLVQIQSQGIENGEPFQFSAEARRVGRC